MAAEKRVNPQFDERDEAAEGQTTTQASLMPPAVTFNTDVEEIEVDPVESTVSPQGERQVVIRVNRPIEEMSFVAGGKSNHYTFEEGHQYRVPVAVALELESIKAVWH